MCRRISEMKLLDFCTINRLFMIGRNCWKVPLLLLCYWYSKLQFSRALPHYNTAWASLMNIYHKLIIKDNYELKNQTKNGGLNSPDKASFDYMFNQSCLRLFWPFETDFPKKCDFEKFQGFFEKKHLFSQKPKFWIFWEFFLFYNKFATIWRKNSRSETWTNIVLCERNWQTTVKKFTIREEDFAPLF